MFLLGRKLVVSKARRNKMKKITNVFMSVKVFHKQTEVNIIKYRSLTQVFDSEKKTYNSTTIKIYNMLK